MKDLVLSLFALLCISSTSLAITPINGDDPGKKVSKSTATLSNVFYEDYSSGTVFIDFDGMLEPLAVISILRGQEVLFTDAVDDLPLNAIYELNTDMMRSGLYTIELETIDGVKVHKDIRVE